MSKKQKKDKRVWVDPSCVHQYVGTIESLKSVVKLLDGTFRQVNDPINYHIKGEGFKDLRLVPRPAINPAFQDHLILPVNWWIAADGDDIFIAESRKKLDKQIRVRTGLVKVTVIIERDDKVVEYLVPSAYDVEMEDISHYGFPEALRFRISNPVKDEKGAFYYQINRIINPDWSYKKWLRGDYNKV